MEKLFDSNENEVLVGIDIGSTTAKVVVVKNGYMVYEQDTEQFADRILEIWNDKNKYNQMSAFAQDFARQYDIKPYVDRLLELYKTN